MTKKIKSGFAAIVGKPNVGKSTVLNWFFNEKLSIVSSKPETTRDNIYGILTTPESQIIFVDTPGIHKGHFLLGREIVKKAKSSLLNADLVLTIIDAASGIKDEDERLLELVAGSGAPSILLLNKVDIVKKPKLLPMIKELSAGHSFLEIIPVSALCGDNMNVVKEKILEFLPKGEKYYPDGQLTNKDINFRISEIIREKALELTRQEVPHSIAVAVEEIYPKEDKGITYIKAAIYVERDSQKSIVIGQNGNLIKQVGTLARTDIEKMINKKVFLDLWVRVLENWRNNPRSIKILGLE